MKPWLSTLLSAVVLICTACENKHNQSSPKEDSSEALDLSTRSNDELAQDLVKLKMVLSDIRDVSETHFTGSQSELERVLAELRAVIPADQRVVTWVPESSMNDKHVEGIIQIRTQPGHLKSLIELIHQFEQETQRRKTRDTEPLR